jgi:hypothetical protein
MHLCKNSDIKVIRLAEYAQIVHYSKHEHDGNCRSIYGVILRVGIALVCMCFGNATVEAGEAITTKKCWLAIKKSRPTLRKHWLHGWRAMYK